MTDAVFGIWAALNLVGRVLLVLTVLAGAQSAASLDVLGFLVCAALGYALTRVQLFRRLGQQ